MPTVSEAWNCSLCAQLLWHAKSRLPGTTRCPVSHMWTHTSTHALQSLDTRAWAGELRQCTCTHKIHTLPNRERDQVHKPGAEGEAPVRSHSKREVSSQLSFSKQTSFWHWPAPHPHVTTSNTAFQYTRRGSKSPFPPLIYLSPVSKHPLYR